MKGRSTGYSANIAALDLLLTEEGSVESHLNALPDRCMTINLSIHCSSLSLSSANPFAHRARMNASHSQPDVPLKSGTNDAG